MSERHSREMPISAQAQPSTRQIAPQILLAYDGSAHAQAALDLVIDLFASCAAGEHCRLTALTVLPTQYIGGHETLYKSLEQARQRLEEAGMRAQALLKAGNPAASIHNYAEEVNADLIVIGAQGLRATLGILLGGVVQQVVEYSQRPVLVVRAPYRGLRRILAATDGSWHSQKMVDYLVPPCEEMKGEARSGWRFPIPPTQEGKTASQIARRRCSWLPQQAQVILMQVLPPSVSAEQAAQAYVLSSEALYPPGAALTPEEVAGLQEEEEQKARRHLEEMRALLQAGGLQVETILRRGDAATELLDFAKTHQVDLIACGSRGLNPISGWLLGSVSRKLVHYAPCSVLVVK